MRRLNSVQDVHDAAQTRNPQALPLLWLALGHRNGEVRLAAARSFAVFGEAGFQALLRAAAHGKGYRREEAVAQLGEWGDVRALKPLLEALQHDKRDRNLQTLLKLGCALLVTIVLGAIAGLMRSGTILFNEQVGAIWSEAFESDVSLRVHAARALGNLGDVRALIPLVQLMHDKNLQVQAAVRSAILKLMPLACALTPQQLRVLGPEAAPQLAVLLAAGDEPLAREALALLSSLGDVRAIPAVERLTADLIHPYLAEQARSTLAALLECAARDRERTTLLRGSCLPQSGSPAQLLRPAHGQSTSVPPTEQLLRPTGKDEG